MSVTGLNDQGHMWRSILIVHNGLLSGEKIIKNYILKPYSYVKINIFGKNYPVMFPKGLQ